VFQNAYYLRRRKLEQQGVQSAGFVRLTVTGGSAHAPTGSIVQNTASVEIDLPCGATVRICDDRVILTVVAALLVSARVKTGHLFAGQNRPGFWWKVV